ncbi:hypothetical protein ABPG72_015257 [Tetrahymena utriculariae]
MNFEFSDDETETQFDEKLNSCLKNISQKEKKRKKKKKKRKKLFSKLILTALIKIQKHYDKIYVVRYQPQIQILKSSTIKVRSQLQRSSIKRRIIIHSFNNLRKKYKIQLNKQQTMIQLQMSKNKKLKFQLTQKKNFKQIKIIQIHLIDYKMIIKSQQKINEQSKIFQQLLQKQFHLSNNFYQNIEKGQINEFNDYKRLREQIFMQEIQNYRNEIHKKQQQSINETLSNLQDFQLQIQPNNKNWISISLSQSAGYASQKKKQKNIIKWIFQCNKVQESAASSSIKSQLSSYEQLIQEKNVKTHFNFSQTKKIQIRLKINKNYFMVSTNNFIFLFSLFITSFLMINIKFKIKIMFQIYQFSKIQLMQAQYLMMVIAFTDLLSFYT